MRAGEKASNLPIVVKNTGDIAWLATGNNPTQISYRWIVKDKGVETFSGENAVFLAENVAPQGAIALNLSIRAPMQAGNYTLQLRIVQGKQGRSESKIVKPIAIPVKIIS
ncbi:MAG: hypothetical protein HC936_10765 [Leptolyngbyaceae cyanobacterium SU_3_3]|nr:hypothetical protein [Leptolyngbyaceae cyanobacterium SU_3_3]